MINIKSIFTLLVVSIIIVTFSAVIDGEFYKDVNSDQHGRVILEVGLPFNFLTEVFPHGIELPEESPEKLQTYFVRSNIKMITQFHAITYLLSIFVTWIALSIASLILKLIINKGYRQENADLQR